MSFSDDLEEAADLYYAAEDEDDYDFEYTAPTLEASRLAHEEVWSEVMPGLWQGGTHDEDVVYNPRRGKGITEMHFDFVTTLYASANPVDWFVQEIRYGIYDSNMADFNMDELIGIARMTHSAWKSGKRTLVRCQAGWNRSGLVTAMVLMLDGMEAKDAIALLREKRSPFALCNATFELWLLDEGKAALQK